MKNLIYYPGFEVLDNNWLKFALLFFADLSTIVPEGGEKTLSDDFKVLEEKGFLSRITDIKWEFKHAATEKAISAVDHILSNPSNYSHLFGNEDPRARWSDMDNWNTELYGRKFHWDWKSFIEKHGFGKESDNGIKLNGELSHIFMSTLVHIMADCEEKSCVTDQGHLDDAVLCIRSEYLKSHRNTVEEQKVLKDILELKMPKNIQHIPLQKIIDFRFHPRNIELHKAMVEGFDLYFSAIETEGTAEGYIDSLKIRLRDFYDALITAGFTLLDVGLVTALSLNDGAVNLLEGGRMGLSGAKGIKDNVKTINKTWKGINSKRKSRQYLMALGNI